MGPSTSLDASILRRLKQNKSAPLHWVIQYALSYLCIIQGLRSVLVNLKNRPVTFALSTPPFCDDLQGWIKWFFRRFLLDLHFLQHGPAWRLPSPLLDLLSQLVQPVGDWYSAKEEVEVMRRPGMRGLGSCISSAADIEPDRQMSTHLQFVQIFWIGHMRIPEPVPDMLPSKIRCLSMLARIHETAGLPGGIYSRCSTSSYCIEAGFSRHFKNGCDC